MSIVFAAIVPHPPLLAPATAKDKGVKLRKTGIALKHLADEMYVAHPDTFVVISAHAGLFPDAFVMNVEPRVRISFKDIGDFGAAYPEFRTNMHLVNAIKEAADGQGLPLQLHNNPTLDHGTSFPLYYLASRLPKARIISLASSLLPLKTHFDFGYLLKDEIMKKTARVALIASGDLSHCLTTDAPGGFCVEGKEFDDTIIELVKGMNASRLLQMEDEFILKTDECLARPLAIFLGVLQRVKVTMNVLSYEHPHGVGYLTAECAPG